MPIFIESDSNILHISNTVWKKRDLVVNSDVTSRDGTEDRNVGKLKRVPKDFLDKEIINTQKTALGRSLFTR